jgi:DNA mismatch repair protein MutS
MSKLLKQYEELKKKDPEKIYIFKVGIFYNILNEDARLVSKEIGLKLTDLSPEIIKCGFPVATLEKYTNLLAEHNIKFEVVSSQTPSYQNASYEQIVKKILNIDLDNTTCKEAFDILYMIQQNLKNIQ